MVVFTAKLTKTKLALFVGGVFVLILLLILAVTSLKSPTRDAAALGEDISFRNIRGNDERVALLEAFGWKVSPEATAIEEVVIPQEFDEVYTRYNEIQKYQGLDLEKYSGKTVKRYTYTIENYPTGEAGVTANLLIYKNRLIGGDVCSPKVGGFMHGLARGT